MNSGKRTYRHSQLALVTLVAAASFLVITGGLPHEGRTSLWLSLAGWLLVVLSAVWLFIRANPSAGLPQAPVNPVNSEGTPSTRKETPKQQDQFDLQTVARKVIRRTAPSGDPVKWGKTLLDQLVTEMEIMSGIYYTGDRKGVFSATATYAYPHPGEPYSFREGEGLTGQAVKNGQVVVYRDIPDDYTRVFSGLGRSKPSYLAIIPVITGKKTTGVLEVAGFRWSDENLEQFYQVLGRQLADALESGSEKRPGERSGNKDGKEAAS